MSPGLIVVVADPVRRFLLQARDRRPGAGVDQFFFVSCEERFRYGIIVTDPRPSQGPPDIVFPAVLIERGRRILPTAVGMKYHTGWRLPGSDGHVECRGDQAGPHVRGDGPANDLA